MQDIGRRILCVFAISVTAVACHTRSRDSDARGRLVSILRDSLGEAAGPNVAFITSAQSQSHLYVTFDTTVAPAVSDSVFELRARDLARFAVRHYDQASELESVTVATRELMQPGLWRVHHSSAFAIAGLKETDSP